MPAKPALTVPVFLSCLASVLAGSPPPAAAQNAAGFRVVVHADQPETSIDRLHLARIFLDKEPRWPSGAPAVPVDQQASFEVRDAFSRAIHRRPAKSIVHFWQRRVFSGRAAPPPQLTTDREVLEFVRLRPGAVGYVTTGAVLGDGVRVLEVVDEVSGEPISAGGAAPAATASDRGASLAGEALRHGDVQISPAGRCGPGGDGERMVVENLSRFDTIRATVETSLWIQGAFRSSSQSSHSLAPFESKDLGCTRLSDSAEKRFALAGVSDAAAHHDPRVARGPAREAVEIVSAGGCGQGRTGQVMQLVNRHPRREVAVKVRYVDRVGGVQERTYTRSLSLAPGDEKRLGCSADGRMTREFEVAAADYR